MTAVSDISPDDLKVFLEEAESLPELLDESIIRLEREADDVELLQEIFRAAHTLKGSSGMLGFDAMAGLTHAMEDLLDRVRKGEQAVTPELIDVLLLSLDGLKALKEELVDEPDASSVDVEPIIAALRAEIDAGGQDAQPDAGPSLQERVREAGIESRLEELTAGDQALLYVRAQIDPETEWAAVRAFQVLQDLGERGEIVASTPSEDEIAEEQAGHTIELLIATDAAPETIAAAVQTVSDVVDVVVESWEQREADAGAPVGAEERRALDLGPEARGKSPRDQLDIASQKIETLQSVRIDVDRLDALMNMVGELAIDRTRIAQISRVLQSQYKEDDQVRALTETSTHIVKLVDGLHESMMQIRMLPVGVLFSKFPRVVRDLARSLGKDVNLGVEGEGTEIDRSVIDKIRDPLVHLMRNAVDHGVETPEGRAAAGKSARSTLKLTARHEQGQILIALEDDGRGIDPGVVREAAVRKGVATQEVVDRLSDREALELIFAPGLSTAQETTEVSGRGVGGDVIRHDIESLNGRVEVESTLGVGTTFTLRLPLTLATFGGLLVVSGERTYALPLSFVRATVRPEPHQLSSVLRRPMLNLRGDVMPLMPLWEATGEGVAPSGARTSNGRSPGGIGHYAVVVEAGSREEDRPVAIGVDDLIDQHEIVVKSLSSYLGRTRGIAGATILGDGQVVLIVDVPTLIKRSLSREVEPTGPALDVAAERNGDAPGTEPAAAERNGAWAA